MARSVAPGAKPRSKKSAAATPFDQALASASSNLGDLSKSDTDIFALRLKRSFGDLETPLRTLYGQREDFTTILDDLARRLAAAWASRPAALKHRDLERDLEPDWFLRENMIGYVFYLDRFNSNLAGVLDKLDYLEELGVTYVHFMPCLMPRPGDSDGGYSVMDYRRIDPRYGTMADFERVTAALRERGISVCV